MNMCRIGSQALMSHRRAFYGPSKLNTWAGGFFTHLEIIDGSKDLVRQMTDSAYFIAPNRANARYEGESSTWNTST